MNSLQPINDVATKGMVGAIENVGNSDETRDAAGRAVALGDAVQLARSVRGRAATGLPGGARAVATKAAAPAGHRQVARPRRRSPRPLVRHPVSSALRFIWSIANANASFDELCLMLLKNS